MSSQSPETSSSTSVSLLKRAQSHDADAWQRLSRIYTPVVYGWARQAGLQRSDSADVCQEVFRTVAARIMQFRRDRPEDSFRGWLWGITRNKLHEFNRRRASNPQAFGGTAAHAQLQCIADIPSDESIEFQRSDSHADLMHRALDVIRVEFEERTWRAFWRTTVDEQSPVDLADELGMTANAIRQSKYRVLRRLRQEMQDLT